LGVASHHLGLAPQAVDAAAPYALAIRGGSPVCGSDRWPEWPVHGPDTVAALAAVVTSGRWSVSGAWTGRITREQEFSRRFAEYCGTPYCVPTANGTSALVVALEALDVGAGDEVIVPGLTWVAPATAALNVNARPVIVDVDPRTLCLDPRAVCAAITPRTRAVIGVHLYGSMVDLDDLLALTRAYGLPLIEDCAQSHGSVYAGRRAGSSGDIGVFSMHQGKVLTSGEGGAAITSDARLARRMEQLRCDGRRYLQGAPRPGQTQLEELAEVQGSNYCLSEFQAALLIDGLGRLEAQNRRREENARYLDAELVALGGIVPIGRPARVQRQTYYHYAVRCQPEAFAGRSSVAISRALEAELGLWVHPPYPPLLRHPLYRPHSKRRYRLGADHWDAIDPRRWHTPVADRANRECVAFHHSALLGERADMDAIVEAFAKVMGQSHEIPNEETQS
jgi:dTDP-4-amino-4,6-dideoxygalactose transaminase